MEVKSGYKQTEVGVIPKEWNSKPLKGRVSIAHGFAFASQYFTSAGDFRLATPGHFFEEGGFRDIGEKQKYYSGPVPSDYVLNPGDLIVAMTEQADGLLGSAAVIPNVAGYLHNQRLGRVKALTSEVHLPYLFWVFNSASYRSKVRETAAGTKVKHTSREKLLEIFVRLPPEPEQRAIAEALRDVDGLLGGLDRLIAKKRDLKQAAMQQLLPGQTRLPGFHGEWRLTKLERLVTADRFAIVDGPFGSQLKVDEYVEAGIPIIEMEHLKDGVISADLPRCITEKKFNALKRSAVYPGDILISKTGTLGRLGLMADSIERGLITSRLAKITLDQAKADRGFVFQSLLKLGQDGYWERVSQGGTMQILGVGMLKNAPVPALSVPEQTAIAEVLTAMDAELTVLEQRREKTRALKQAMMQELLTGRTRLL